MSKRKTLDSKEAVLQELRHSQLETRIAPLLAILKTNLPALVSLVKIDGTVLYACDHFTLLMGVADDVSQIKNETQLYPPFVVRRVEEMISEDSKHQAVNEWELSIKHKDGKLHLYELKRYLIKDEDPKQSAVCTIGIDVTDHRLSEEALKDQKSHINYMAFHDSLTGLPNRSLFYDRMNKSLSRAKRNRSSLALLLIDMDRFKNINESLGHDAGDIFLKKCAKSIQEEVRETDTVARLSGDEFVVVLENIEKSSDIENIAEKLLERLSVPVNVRGHEIACTASIGVTVFPNDGDSVDQLLKHADMAMYKAKAAGKNCFKIFVRAMKDTAVNFLLLENDLRRAIDNNDLELHYQPQVDLSNGKIIGLEALVRWNHKHRGLISPIHFIPLAEETGLIEPLGEWVMRHACERFYAWIKNGTHLGKIAVNLSARQFRQKNFEQTVVNVLMESCLPPEYLELEITESSAMENAAEAVDMLNGLSKMGLSISIDDFGTGYSSLTYLKRFPIQKLKIDKSFIKDIDTEKSDAAIAKSIIDLAHNMSLQVIAEGVERPTQLRWLQEKGCDQVQGYYYSKPLSEEKLMAFISSDKVKKDSTGVRLMF